MRRHIEDNLVSWDGGAWAWARFRRRPGAGATTRISAPVPLAPELPHSLCQGHQEGRRAGRPKAATLAKVATKKAAKKAAGKAVTITKKAKTIAAKLAAVMRCLTENPVIVFCPPMSWAP